VPIKASSTKQIAALVADLGAASDIIREAAVARLILIGGRAVGRLVTVADSDAPGPTRIGAFRVLDAIGHPRALAPALRAIDDTDSKVAIAAVGVASRKSTSAAIDPGRATVSGLRSRTYRPRAAAIPRLFARAKPAFSPISKIATDGNSRRSISTTPSVDWLSTTMTS